MIFLSIGLPGRFTDRCETMIARVLGHSGETVLVKKWPSQSDMLGYGGVSSTLDELVVTLIGTNATHLVMGARQPDERLRSGLAETGARFFLLLDDPRNALSDLLAVTQCDLNLAVRAIANSCPFVMQYEGMPQAIVIRAALDDAETAMAKIAARLGITLSKLERRQIGDDLASDGPTGHSDATAQQLAQLPDAARRMVDGALGGYNDFFTSGKLGQIVWTRHLFKLADDPDRCPRDVVDVTGGARNLIYGPYIYLPPGSWNARVHLGFSAEAAGHSFLIDAYTGGRQLACTSFRPDRSGTCTPDITFSLDGSLTHGLEIRVISADDNAKGQLAFGNVILSPLAIRQPDSIERPQDDFRAVLDL